MQLQTIDFRGDALEYLQQGEQRWLPLRRFCEALGIDAEAQRLKLTDEARAPWAQTFVMKAREPGGLERQHFCLDLDTLAMWLATIDSSRVAPEARAKVVLYQRECAKVLRAHFFGGEPLPRQLTGVERFRRRETHVAKLSAYLDSVREMTQATDDQFAAAWMAGISAAVGHLTRRPEPATPPSPALPAPAPADDPIPYRVTAPRKATPRPPYPFAAVRRAIEMHASGATWRQISGVIGAHPDTVKEWVKVYGASIRGGVQ